MKALAIDGPAAGRTLDLHGHHVVVDEATVAHATNFEPPNQVVYYLIRYVALGRSIRLLTCHPGQEPLTAVLAEVGDRLFNAAAAEVSDLFCGGSS